MKNQHTPGPRAARYAHHGKARAYMNLPACHEDSPLHAAYVARVAELEAEGCDTSDAQGIADMEFGN